MTDEKSDEAIESEFIRVTGLTPAQALHEMYREALKIEKGFVLDGDFLSPQERAAVLRIKAAVTCGASSSTSAAKQTRPSAVLWVGFGAHGR